MIGARNQVNAEKGSFRPRQVESEAMIIQRGGLVQDWDAKGRPAGRRRAANDEGIESSGGAATLLGELGKFAGHDQLGALFLEVVIDMIKSAPNQMNAEATGLDEIEGTSL